MTRPSSSVVVAGMAALSEGAGLERPPLCDDELSRLRRMDRFGRNGFAAGVLALRDAGIAPFRETDVRSGVVFGSAWGCRDSVAGHAALVASSRSVEELSPAVFAQTVHNTVCGELAIAWRFGGVSETVVSGRTAGLEALALAARAVASRAADRVVTGGAEGLNGAMREAFDVEKEARGPRAKRVVVEEAAAALVLVREGEPDSVPRARWVDGTTFFEPAPAAARGRLLAWVAETGADRVVLASPDHDGAFDGDLDVERDGGAERFGAAGPFSLVRALGSAAARSRIAVLVRDPDGPCAAVAVETAFNVRSRP